MVLQQLYNQGSHKTRSGRKAVKNRRMGNVCMSFTASIRQRINVNFHNNYFLQILRAQCLQPNLSISTVKYTCMSVMLFVASRLMVTPWSLHNAFN